MPLIINQEEATNELIQLEYIHLLEVLHKEGIYVRRKWNKKCQSWTAISVPPFLRIIFHGGAYIQMGISFPAFENVSPCHCSILSLRRSLLPRAGPQCPTTVRHKGPGGGVGWQLGEGSKPVLKASKILE